MTYVFVTQCHSSLHRSTNQNFFYVKNQIIEDYRQDIKQPVTHLISLWRPVCLFIWKKADDVHNFLLRFRINDTWQQWKSEERLQKCLQKI